MPLYSINGRRRRARGPISGGDPAESGHDRVRKDIKISGKTILSQCVLRVCDGCV